VPHVRLEGITRRFGRVVANDRIDFDLEQGEIHALLGENGAGKTTLMGILYGLLVPDEGAVFVDGQRVAFRSPQDAAAQGIGMVHQHFMLIPSFTVAENIALGTQSRGRFMLDAKEIEARIESISGELRLQVDPRARVEDLSVGGQQRVEIVKALNREPSVLILDEPTSVLTPREVDDLCQVLRRLKARGLAVVFIAHKLDEVMAISDRVTVLRDGRVISTVKTGETTKGALARMMVGRDISMTVEKSSQAPGAPLLRIVDLEVLDERKTRALDRLSFSVRAGEIFGIAGVAGNGQTELAECIAGLRPSHGGSVLLDGEEITDEKPWELLDRRMAHIPEDRSEQGLAKGLSVAENSILGFHRTRTFGKWGFLNQAARPHAERLVRDFSVATPSVETEVRFLSGGNQQKVILARELHAEPRFIVAVQPTRGLDIAATEFVHRRLLRERDRGAGILLISTDLSEVLELSDRVGVLHQGKLMDIISNPKEDLERIGLLMAGSAAAAASENGAR
jgi:simple sugar transport system ATP-binding protein